MNKVDSKKTVSFSNLITACIIVIIINCCLTVRVITWNNERGAIEARKAEIELEK